MMGENSVTENRKLMCTDEGQNGCGIRKMLFAYEGRVNKTPALICKVPSII